MDYVAFYYNGRLHVVSNSADNHSITLPGRTSFIMGHLVKSA
jgi:hypothetical protein